MGSNNNDMYFNNSPSNPFLKISMSLWQQSAAAMIEMWREYVIYSQRVTKSCLDILRKTRITEEDNLKTENISLQGQYNNHSKYKTKEKMRALILQGGGALGAFEAGAFKVLYEKLTREDKENGKEDRPLFDIVAGTSIGAINAAILVSYVIENKSWRGSAEKLLDFWEYLSCPTPDITKSSATWKKEFDKKNNADIASEEAARRYYSVKEFLKSGIDKIHSPILPPKEDRKFFDLQNKRVMYDKQPLKKSIERFAKFPIATNYEKKEPRLLVVTTDVSEGTTATFDSYEKNKNFDGKENRKTVYTDLSNQKSIVIEYNEGIGIQHVIASASVPEFYEYEEIGGRKFLDGGILSNTPIRELIQAHKAFWKYRIGSNELERSILDEANFRVPDLELYVVNLWHSNDNAVPIDPDGIAERLADIKSHDQHYVKESVTVTHYTRLIEKLIQLGNSKNYELKKEINKILEEYTDSVYATEDPKKYIDLIKTQFEISKLEIIERRDDGHTIAGKTVDFTSGTIKKLINEGYQGL